MKKSGLAIHCHHNTLIEYCYNYDARVTAIKRYKPEHEQKIRLRLFKLLPQKAIDELPKRLVKAVIRKGKASDKWGKAYVKRREAFAKWRKKVATIWEEKAYVERKKASAKWKKVEAEWKEKDQGAWHKRWCGCKEWNGSRIVFKP